MNQKGFTVIEGLIVAVIAIVVILLIFSVVRSINGENYCEFYRYSTIQDTPVSCFEYLTSGEGKAK